MNTHSSLNRPSLGSRARWLAVVACIGLLGIASARADNAGVHAPGVLNTQDGGAIYRQICQGCHMARGQGAVGAGYYPALAGNPTLASTRYVALTVLQGRRNMPAFEPQPHAGGFFVRPSLTDAQTAAVINYVRSHFGNHYLDTLTASDVAAMHAPAR